jgi:hypothetical protein
MSYLFGYNLATIIFGAEIECTVLVALPECVVLEGGVDV